MATIQLGNPQLSSLVITWSPRHNFMRDSPVYRSDLDVQLIHPQLRGLLPDGLICGELSTQWLGLTCGVGEGGD